MAVAQRAQGRDQINFLLFFILFIFCQVRGGLKVSRCYPEGTVREKLSYDRSNWQREAPERERGSSRSPVEEIAP